MIRISKKPEERKNEIIKTALELFSINGYERTTIHDIAKKMGVSQGLCYRYFKSKQDIYAATATYYAEKCIEDLDAFNSINLSAVDKLNSIFFQLITHAANHNEFEASNKKSFEVQAPRVAEVAEKTIAILTPIIQQGIDEKTFSCSEVEKTTRFLTYGIFFMLHPSEMPQDLPKEYILSHRNTIKILCERVLGADESAGIGCGWENIQT